MEIAPEMWSGVCLNHGTARVDGELRRPAACIKGSHPPTHPRANADSPAAFGSALTYSTASSASRSRHRAAVVLQAPFGPATTTKIANSRILLLLPVADDYDLLLLLRRALEYMAHRSIPYGMLLSRTICLK